MSPSGTAAAFGGGATAGGLLSALYEVFGEFGKKPPPPPPEPSCGACPSCPALELPEPSPVSLVQIYQDRPDLVLPVNLEVHSGVLAVGGVEAADEEDGNVLDCLQGVDVRAGDNLRGRVEVINLPDVNRPGWAKQGVGEELVTESFFHRKRVVCQDELEL